jgi:hypothetical protein
MSQRACELRVIPTLNRLAGSDMADDLATSERVPEMLFGTEVGASQQEESREECPEHQAYRQRERPIDFGEIELGQGQDVAVFQRLREQSRNDGGGQNGARWNLAIG